MFLLPNPTPIHQRSSSASTLLRLRQYQYSIFRTRAKQSLETLAPSPPDAAPAATRRAHAQQGWLAHTDRAFPTGTMDIFTCQGASPGPSHHPQQPPDPSLERQATRARQLVHLGELSAARQALTAGPLAPGTAETLQELRNPTRRPNEPYAPSHPSLSEFQPDQPVHLPDDLILMNLRRARKGAAPGPSGLTTDTLRILLGDDTATTNLIRVARHFAQASIPAEIARTIGLGRMVALTKPNGRVRGIVVGDVLRRLVSRCLAQKYAQPIHTACQPHQFALATRSGTEAVVHALTAVTEANPTHTILSVDGVGAYDNISRNSMLQGLRDVPEANRCLPFVKMFYGAPSQYIWHSATGEAHIISQAEGGEQGDPLMPALFSLGQRAALRTMQQHLLPNESLLAFLDDVYVVVPPNRVRPVYDTLAHTLQSQASIQLNQGKTRAWNAAGIEPPNIRDLGEDVWVGNPNLPAASQGMTVLGAPIGSAAFVQHQLQQANQQHQHLLDRIPHLEDLQASWLLLLYCASPRCTYLLRMCSPNVTTEFANNHDFAVAACLRRLLAVDDLPAQALATAHLPLSQGGLGLTCASILATPAFWSSWADSLPVLHTELPQYAAQILEHLQHPSAAIPSIQAAAAAAQALEERGWTPPSWTELTQGTQPDPSEANTEEAPRTRGWQQQATIPVHTANYNELQAAIPPASQAMLQSQAGPFASRAFTTIPYSAEFEYPSHLFRILLLRRLRLHLPLSARSCRCRRPLDPLGDHRAACAQSGVLRSRGGPLERAAARICREGGARVTTNTRLADLNIQNLSRVDDRRIEVIANGLPMWGGSQLAVDTTLVSPLTRTGEPRSRGGTYAGAALHDARRSKERTYPELLNNRRCRLVVLGIEVGGRWSNEASNFICMLAKARARSSPPSLQAATSAALVSRWSALLTHAAATSFAASLLFEDLSPHHNQDGDPRSATSFHTRAHPCLSVASQHGSGRSGLTPSLPQAHLETGQYKNSLCLEAAQYNSPVSMDLLRLKRSGGKKKKKQAWVRVCREGLGGEGRVVPQQWLARTTAPGVREDDRRRLDLVVYGATRHGSALCCDVTLVSPFKANGHPQPRTAREDGAALVTARRRKRDRYPELLRLGPSASSSWPVKLEGAGPQNVVTSSVTCCGFAPRGLPLPSARLAGPAGSAGGGHCWAVRNRTQSLPPCSAMCGAAPARHGRQMARRWAKCSGWLALRSQAGSPSDPKGKRRIWAERTAFKKVRRKKKIMAHVGGTWAHFKVLTRNVLEFKKPLVLTEQLHTQKDQLTSFPAVWFTRKCA